MECFIRKAMPPLFFINAVFPDDNIAWDGFNSGSFVRIKVGDSCFHSLTQDVSEGTISTSADV